MTTYNSFEAAKIANPSEDIYMNEIGQFQPDKNSVLRTMKCNPADHCMTVEKFLADGHKFVEGDLIYSSPLSKVISVSDIGKFGESYPTKGANNSMPSDNERYILRASALENIPTETPEEKEVLDGIESAGEVEWKNGDDVDAYGKPYKYVGLDPFNENLCICLANQDDDPQCFSIDVLKKPETPQQREERERLEAAYDLHCSWCKAMKYPRFNFEQFKTSERDRTGMLAIVDKTNYRKEKTNGTN